MASFEKQKIYALAGVLGGVAFGGAYLLGSGITIATGIPIMSSTINGFWVGMIIALSLYLLRDYNFISTSIMLVYGLAATFTVLLGPPGWYKIPIALIMGLLWDLSFKIIPKLLGQIIGAILFMGVGTFLIIIALKLQQSPAIDKIISVLPLMLSISIPSALVGAIIGHSYLGKRLDRLPIIIRLLGK